VWSSSRWWRPREVTDCNCSICPRYGVLWAYYEPGEVVVRGLEHTEVYLWVERKTAFHRCRTCGCVTRWSGVHPDRRHMGSFDDLD
jgi:hypothetical protein